MVKKKAQDESILLRWTDRIPTSDVQDPLGLALRGSARLASRLLFCITSITPRARYFSFLTWCFHDHHNRERGKSWALPLEDAIVLREHALTLGCVVHHSGEPCSGGALVGSRAAQRWLEFKRVAVDLRKLNFAQNPALDAYFNSLLNLGFFATEQQLPESDVDIVSDSDAERIQISFDDIELSELGLRVATAYDRAVARIPATTQIASSRRTSTVRDLAQFGERGGLCELREKGAPDRDLLADIFFARTGLTEQSHHVRRMSLLLLMELCKQCGAKGVSLKEDVFADATYFGYAFTDEDSAPFLVRLPAVLEDIRTRWKLFYFHHYMGVALEGIFLWIVQQLHQFGLAGASVEHLAQRLSEKTLARDLKSLIGFVQTGAFASSRPVEVFAFAGVNAGPLSQALGTKIEKSIDIESPLAERQLEMLIRSREHNDRAVGLALPLLLLATTLSRFKKYDETNYGLWLASAADDPYLDLIPPTVAMGLERRFGNWWEASWGEIATFVISRFVVRQHITMSYEKSALGERCLLQDDGDKVRVSGEFDKVGMGNVRFRSALQVLEDLALIEADSEDVHQLTPTGAAMLKGCLAEEARREVS